MALRRRGKNWHYRFMVAGREYSGDTGFAATKPLRKDAQAREAELWRAVREGRSPAQRLIPRTFSDAAAEYLAWCRGEYRAHPSTARRIAASFTSLRERLGSAMVAAIGAAEIEAYKTWRISECRVRDVTLRHDLHALSGFFRWALRVNYAAENPVRRVSIPSDKDAIRMHVLTAAEERAYFAAAGPLLNDFGRLMILQGLRPDEVLRTEAADVDLAAGKLAIRRGKTRAARRTLTLTQESRAILGRRIGGGGPLFRVSASGLAKMHGSACRAAGVDFVLYDLRHTFATRMAEAGCDLATLAAILGHSGLRVVQRYVHPTAAHQAAAMARYDAIQREKRETEAVQ